MEVSISFPFCQLSFKLLTQIVNFHRWNYEHDYVHIFLKEIYDANMAWKPNEKKCKHLSLYNAAVESVMNRERTNLLVKLDRVDELVNFALSAFIFAVSLFFVSENWVAITTKQRLIMKNDPTWYKKQFNRGE